MNFEQEQNTISKTREFSKRIRELENSIEICFGMLMKVKKNFLFIRSMEGNLEIKILILIIIMLLKKLI